MATLPIKQFLGLRLTSDPEVGTAVVASNVKRNLTRGRLENADGAVALDLYAGLGTLPVNDSNLGISAISLKKPFSFYIADSGGSTVYAVAGTYTKTAHGIAGTTVNTSGLWISRFYDTAWQTGWRELSEFYIFRYASAANVTAETMDITLSNVGGVAPSVVSAYVTEGFVVVNGGSFTNTVDTGFKVVSMTGNVLRVVGQTGDIAAWGAGSTLLYVYRNNFNKVLPAAMIAQFRTVLDEIRLTTGNSTTDLDISAFYRDKTFFVGNTLTRKGTYGEFGHLDVPSLTFKMRNLAVTALGTAGLPAGVYGFKASMLMDDGQETELRDVLTTNFPATIFPSGTDTNIGNNANTPICTDGTNIYVASFGQMPTPFIVKLDADGNVLATKTFVLATDGGIQFLGFKGGFLYAVHLKPNDQQAVVKYDTSLQILQTGIFAAQLPTTGAPAGFNYFAISDNYIFNYKQNAGQTAGYAHRYNLSTLAVDQTYNHAVAWTYNGYVSADDSYFVCAGGNNCFKFPSVLAAPTSVYAGMGSVATTASVITGGVCYIGATTILKKWVLSTDTITNHLTGGLSNGWFGMTFDGTYIYGKNDTTVKKVDTSGTLIASYVETLALDLVYPIVTAGTRIYGLSINAKLRKFANIPSAATLTSSGTEGITFDLAVSPGYVPRRGKAIRLYINKDAGAYYFAKEYSFIAGGETFSATSVYDSTQRHRYFVSTGKAVNGSDYAAATVTATAQLGRIQTDTGILPYSYAITANNRTYAVGVFIAGRLIRNKVYLNALSGDGISQFDVLANDVTTILDVEFNDGDYAIALGNVADRVLVLKNRSLVLLTPNTDGTHQRDVVATGVGIASADTLVAFNEALYWLDHTGVWEFTTRGLRNVGEGITSIILGLTDVQKAAAFAVIDPKNLQYRVFVGGVWYCLDLKDGEWTTETPAGTPLAAAVDVGSVGRRYMMMSATQLYKPSENALALGATLALQYQTNKIELPLERGYDGLVSALYCDYSSPVALSMSLYLDDKQNPTRTYTLPTTGNGVVVPAPLAARCKSFRLEIQGTITAAAQNAQIRRLGAYFNQIPVGGSVQTMPLSTGGWLYRTADGNGSTDYGAVTSGTPFTTTSGGAPTDMVIEFWLRQNQAVTGSTNMGSLLVFNSWYLFFISKTGYIWFGVQPNENYDTTMYKGTDLPVVVGETHHYAFVLDTIGAGSSYLTVYRDGALWRARTIIGKDSRGSATSTDLRFGRNFNNIFGSPGNVYAANCDYDEVRIWNIARSQGDIIANKNVRITGAQTGLVARYGFENFNVNQINDTAGSSKWMNNTGGTLGTIAGLF